MFYLKLKLIIFFNKYIIFKMTSLKNLNGAVLFTKWNDMEEYIKFKTGCKPFSGAGINYRKNEKTTILKSVDDTYYYNDNLNDIKYPKYTLFGHNGDQDENEPKFNEPLLNQKKTNKIYLYRVTKDSNYIWYGKYKIIGKENQQNIGKDNTMRKIIVLSLEKI